MRGGAGNDILRSDDSGDTTNNTGTLTATLLTGLGTQGIDYDAFEAFGLALGSGSDTLTITSQADRSRPARHRHVTSTAAPRHRHGHGVSATSRRRQPHATCSI